MPNQNEHPDEEVAAAVEAHPDEAPPSRELKDIALKSAARAARFDDLSETVGVLTTEVIGLRTEVSKAVKQDEFKVAQRHERKVLLGPAIVVAVSMVVVGIALVALLIVAQGNRKNGNLIINCTTAPPPHATAKQIRDRACYERGVQSTAEAIRHLECTNLLLHGQAPAVCEDVRRQLEAQGVHIPVDNTGKAP
jgi:hypothetical protein